MKRFLVAFVLLNCLILTSSLYAQWTKVNGPLGGFVYTITGNECGMFIGVELQDFQYQPYNSTRWISIGKPWHLYLTSSFVQDSTVYFSTMGDGVNRSSDFGANWEKIPQSVISDSVWSINGDDNVILAGTYGKGLFMSKDKGRTWTRTGREIPTSHFWASAIYDSVYYVYSSARLYYSTDFGNSWIKPVSQAMTQTMYTINKTSNKLFVGGHGGVFVSSDNGKNWVSVNNEIFTGTSVPKIVSIGETVFAQTYAGGIYKTVDYGASWIDLNPYMITCFCKDMYVRDNVLYIATNGGGVLRTTDLGITWESYSEGLSSVGVYNMLFDENKIFITTHGRGVCVSDSSGSEWYQSSYNTDLVHARETFKYANYIYAVNFYGVYRKSVLDDCWNKISDRRTSKAFVLNEKLFGICSNNFCCSSDSGKTWQPVDNSIPAGSRINLISINGVLFGVANSETFKSANSGVSWIKMTGLPNFVDIVEYKGKLFAATETGVYVSTNNGNSWVKNNDINGTAIYKYNADLFLGSTGGRVYRYKDNTWELITTSELTTVDRVSDIGAYNGYLYFSCEYSGLYKCPLSDVLTTVEENDVNIPNDFTLSQNYPNPFNPSTTIAFSIPTSAFVTLKIYDVLGKEVANLCNEELPAGKYSRNWDASKCASGMYVYQIKAGDFVSSKKLMLMK